MKVLYVTHTGKLGGGERSLLQILRTLPDDVAAVVACPPGALEEALKARGVRTVAMPEVEVGLRVHPVHTLRGVLRLAVATAALVRHARRERPDVVHANSARAGLVAIGAALIAGRPPVLVHVRDCLPPRGTARLVQQILSRAAAKVLANSAHTAAAVEAATGSRPVVVHPAVDLKHFEPGHDSRTAIRSRLGFPEDSALLAVVGQVTPWKGQDDAVRILACLRRRLPDVRLLVVGEPKFTSASTRFDNPQFARSLRELCGRLGVADAVTFIGEREDVRDILSSLDLLLVPSWEEPFGRVVLEAMAMEVPVLATEVGGPSELLTGDLSVLLLPPRSPQTWAGAAEALLTDPESTAALARLERVRALEFAAAALPASDVYRSVLADGAQRSSAVPVSS